MRTTIMTAALVVTTALLATASLPAHAETLPATGTFQMTTSPGILPTWTRAGIAIIGITPGSVITSSANSNARIDLPVVNKTGTANAAAGGFRIVNTRTGDEVRCFVPTIDTRARLIDCQIASGENLAIFAIVSIQERSKASNESSRTTIFQDMDIRLADADVADRLNAELDTTVFSASVQVGEGYLIVTRGK